MTAPRYKMPPQSLDRRGFPEDAPAQTSELGGVTTKQTVLKKALTKPAQTSELGGVTTNQHRHRPRKTRPAQTSLSSEGLRPYHLHVAYDTRPAQTSELGGVTTSSGFFARPCQPAQTSELGGAARSRRIARFYGRSFFLRVLCRAASPAPVFFLFLMPEFFFAAVKKARPASRVQV